MNENVNLMMKHMLRLAEAYEKLLKEVVQLRQEVAICKLYANEFYTQGKCLMHNIICATKKSFPS